MEENKLTTQPAVMQAVIQITRKATGKVEEYVLTGSADEVKAQTDSELTSERHE